MLGYTRFFSCALVLLWFGQAAAERFSFVVLGDTSYTEASYPAYEQLIDTINQDNPRFTIHVGDTLGYQNCEAQTYKAIDGFFARFEMPLIYTPGDNEWTDCEIPGSDARAKGDWEAVADYKLGRLAALRKRYFSTNQSLGKRTIALKRQSEYGKPEHQKFVENVYWISGEVLFATVHIVGSADSFHPYIQGQTEESIARRNANYAWILQLAKTAKTHDVKAIVVATHAEMFERNERLPYHSNFSGTMIKGGKYGPYVGYVHALSVLASKFTQPILLLHGDHHRFVIDRPLTLNRHGKEPGKMKFENLIRAQVVGHPELKALKVTVDTKSNGVFGFSQLY